MTSIREKYSEEDEFDSWQIMKEFSLAQLHTELTSPVALRRDTAAKWLHIKGDKTTFDFATQLAQSKDAIFRQSAAEVLGQLGLYSRPFLKQSLPVLHSLLSQDENSCVRASAASSLGHLASTESIDHLIRAVTDTDPGVRASVAFALGEMHDIRAIPSLITLSYDSIVDPDVRGWAVLAMRLSGINSSVMRDRFIDLLSDPRSDIRDEAIAGLADLQDVRVLPVLDRVLCEEDVNLELFEAAEKLGDRRILPRLQSLQEVWGDSAPSQLKRAIQKLSQ